MNHVLSLVCGVFLFASFQVDAAPPIGKTIKWKAAQIKKIYKGKPKTTIFKVFGKPVDASAGIWTYTGMDVTDAVSGSKFTKVWFFINDEGNCFGVSLHK